MSRIILPHPPGLWTPAYGPRRGSSRIYVRRAAEGEAWVERGQWVDRRYFSMLVDSFRTGSSVAPNTYYLNTTAGGGGDGSLGSPWNTLESSRSGLVSLFGSGFVSSTVAPFLICSGATDDTTAVTNTWPTSSSTYFLTIKVPDADRKVTWDNNVYTYGRSVNFTSALQMGTDSCRMIGLQFYHAGFLNVGGNNGLYIDAMGGVWILDGLKVAKSNNAGDTAILTIGTSGTLVIRNCVTGQAVAGGASFGFGHGIWAATMPSSSTVIVYNVTTVLNNNGSGTGVEIAFTAGGSAKVARVKNTLIQTSANGVTITNATTSDTATNHHNSGTDAAFVDASTGDLRLTGSDTVAKDQGTDLSGVSDYPFSEDASMTTRPQGSAWDIGAHEYV